MKTDHKFNPRNETEVMIQAAMENGSEILCKALDVDVTLRMERMNGWASSDAFHAGKWCILPSMVKINMRNLYGASLDTILQVLGHEFRHSVQTIHGVCDTVPDTNLPKNHWLKNSYWNKPIEKDARKYQKAYASLIVNNPDFRYRDNLKAVVPGEALKIPDYDATYLSLGLNPDRVQLFRDRQRTQYWFSLDDVPGNPKKWTKKVYKTVWGELREQLMRQKFELVYQEATLDDLVS